MKTSQLLTSVSFLIISFVLNVSAAWADIDLEEFEAVINKHISKNEYVQAEIFAQNAITQATDPFVALRANTALAKVYICSDQFESAETLTSDLIFQSSTNPSIVQSLCEIGDTWRSRDQIDRARILYQHAINDFGENSFTIWAQKNLCTLYLDVQNEQAAQVATDDLLSTFINNPNISQAVCEVGDAWLSSDKMRAIALYRHVVENFPDSNHSIWSQKNLCILYIELKDASKTDAAVLTLKAVFEKHDNIAKALCEVGDACRDSGLLGKAADIYKYVLDQYSATDHALWSLQNLAIMAVGLGQDQVAEALVDKLMIEYRTNPLVAKSVFLVGEEYYNLADKSRRLGQEESAKMSFLKAIAIWDRNIKQLDELQHKQYAYYFSGGAYLYIQDYSKAIEYLQEVVDQWPDYESAWNVHRLIGICHLTMGQKRMAPLGPSRLAAEKAYQKVVDNYSDCPKIGDVMYRLGKLKYTRALWIDAAQCFDVFVSKCGEDVRKPDALYYLGKSFDFLGRREDAKEAYKLYLSETSVQDRHYESVQNRLGLL